MTRQPDGTYTIDDSYSAGFGRPERRLLCRKRRRALVRHGRQAGAIRHDEFERSTPPFSALIRRITVNQTIAGVTTVPEPRRRLPAEQPFGSLRVRGAVLPRTSARRSISRRLDGLDADWSAWSHRGAARLHQPGFGDYRFHVRARSVTEPGQRRRPSMPSPSCRRGTAPGGPTRCYLLAAVGLVVSARPPAAPPRGRQGARARPSSPRRGCAPRRPKRWRAPRAKARRTSSC